MPKSPKTHLNISDLAEFLRYDLYDKWGKDRQDLETKWQENEDAFDGISSGTWKLEEGEDWRSNTFVMQTKKKVLTAYSMVVDVAMEGGQLPFNLDLSPWDDINLEDLDPVTRAQIEDALGDMNGLIHQQILDCKGDQETIKCIMAAAKLGETYWKSFVHDVTRKGFRQVNMAPPGGMSRYDNQWEYFENAIKSPGFRHVSTWDMFRDLEMDDMQLSRGYTERSYTSTYGLRQLIGKDPLAGYIDESIQNVIRECGKNTAKKATSKKERPGIRRISDRYNNIERLDFYCRVPRETLERFEYELEGKDREPGPQDEYDEYGDEAEIYAVLAGEEVIRLVRTRPETRPHGRVVWELKLDDDHGTGVADNMKNTQLSINGAFRAFEDNKKLSGNVMTASQSDKIVDWDGTWKPGTNVEIAPEAKGASDAMQQIVIQDVGESLLSLIGILERYGDEDTHLPKILQGATHEKQKVDTLGEIEILQTNAGKYIGSVFKNFDNGMFEPITWRFYEYNMLDPDLEKGKGNYIAQPKGYEFFRDKVIRIHKILQALQLIVQNPNIATEIRFKDLYNEVFKSLSIDPDKAWKTDEEKQQDAMLLKQQQQEQLDQAGLVMLAEMKAKTESEIEKIRAKVEGELKVVREKAALEFENKVVEKKIEADSDTKNN